MAQARREMRQRMGRLGLLDVDPAIGTPRAVGRLDGFLTRESARDGEDIALRYVRARPEVFGLDSTDLSALELVRHYSVGGIEHVSWAQTYRGIKAIDSSLTANLTATGRLLNVQGSPRPDLSVPSIEPKVAPATAYAAAARRLGGSAARATRTASGPERATRFAGGGTARLVIFEGAAGPRLGWRLLVPVDRRHVYDAVVDASTGTLARHQNLVEEADATIYRNYPGAPNGGSPETVNIDAHLDPAATRLFGPAAHTFADTGDVVTAPGDAPPVAGDVAPSGGHWTYALTNVGSCTPLPCVWDPATANSWSVNLKADATQLHWSVSNFHDHLENTPAIAFTAAAGNFEGTDRVLAQSMDGANTAAGFPNGAHINNANMLTLPDGFSPHMQMYLTDATQPASTAFDASVVYHEYTHGLVGRTIVDADGFQAVGGAQGGAINEGTADWYALDYLVGQGHETDNAASRDVTLGKFTFGGIRYQPSDCQVGDAGSACPDVGGGAGPGGYTYGDFGRIVGAPEVHADGEIFTQTMWQLRQTLIAKHGTALGTAHARRLYTNGMRMAPVNPTFLDMRNAILQADTAAGFGDSPEIWDVFAARGMGYFASSTDAGDTTPVESFADLPPAGGPTGTVTGTITEAPSGDPVAGARVAFTGHDSGVGPELSATTNASGVYSIPDVPAGTYPVLRVSGGGLEPGAEENVAVSTGTNTRDFVLRRNLAAVDGGASIHQFTGPDYTTSGCGPGGLIDGTQGVVWGSTAPSSGGAKSIVVKLSQAAQVTSVEIDPGAGCGDDDSASLGAYELHVSPDGTTYTKVKDSAFTSANNHRFNEVIPTATPAGTRYVKLVAKGVQSTAGSGATFMDVSEMRVFASAAPAQPPAATTQAATAVTATGATLKGLVDPNGTATDYQFEYGTTASYGSVAPAVPLSAGSGDSPVAVSQAIAGLSPSTTYHYRVVAVRGGTRTNGADQTFTTAAASGGLPVDPIGGDPPGGDPAPGGGQGTATTPPPKAVSGKSRTVKVSCTPAGPGRTRASCRVTFRKAARRRASVRILKGRKVVASGSTRRADRRGTIRARGATALAPGRYRVTIAVRGMRKVTYTVRLS